MSNKDINKGKKDEILASLRKGDVDALKKLISYTLEEGLDREILHEALEIIEDHYENSQKTWTSLLDEFLRTNNSGSDAHTAYKKLIDILGKFQSGSTLPLARSRVTKWQQVVYSPVTMLQLSMPHKDQGNSTRYEVSNGEASILLRSGDILDENGNYIPSSLPCNTFPRLVLFYVNFYVNTMRKQEIFLGYSMWHFFQKLGLTRQDDSYQRFHEQMSRLLSCRIIIGRTYPAMDIPSDDKFPFEGAGEKIEYKHFSSGFDRWKNRNDTQRGYNIHLSDEIYKSMLENPVPIDMEIVKKMTGSPLQLDIYAFLAERLYRIPAGEPEQISWQDIAELFGSKYSDKRRFYRDKFKPALKKVCSYYPDFHVETDKNHITLFHSEVPDKLLPFHRQ